MHKASVLLGTEVPITGSQALLTESEMKFMKSKYDGEDAQNLYAHVWTFLSQQFKDLSQKYTS